MANKIVASIDGQAFTSNTTVTSDAVALGPNESEYVGTLNISNRTDGTGTLTVQTSTSADGPWVTWFALAGASADGLTFDFPSSTESQGGLLFARLSLASTSVTTGFTATAQLLAKQKK